MHRLWFVEMILWFCGKRKYYLVIFVEAKVRASKRRAFLSFVDGIYFSRWSLFYVNIVSHLNEMCSKRAYMWCYFPELKKWKSRRNELFNGIECFLALTFLLRFSLANIKKALAKSKKHSESNTNRRFTFTCDFISFHMWGNRCLSIFIRSFFFCSPNWGLNLNLIY